MGTLAAPQHLQETMRDRATADPSRVTSAVARQASGGAGYFGNQAALRRLSRPTPRIQCKLEIGAVDDPLEAEADRIAEQVMRMPEPAATPAQDSVLRRKCAECEEGDKKLHRKSNNVPQVEGEAPPIVHEVLNSPGEHLDEDSRVFFETRFGRDFSQVLVHNHSRAASSAEAVHARAYTVGPHMVFGAREYAPHTTDGQRLLAHELTHTVQQSYGRENPGLLQRTTHGPSTPTNCHNWTIPLPPWIAGAMAHAQISSTLGILPGTIPRATKVLIGVPSPPPITPFGFADLWRVIGPAVNIGEIKSTATGSGVAAAEVVHYILRHTESLGRIATGTGDARDASYLAKMGGVPLPGNPLDLSSITGTDLPLGLFTGDPGKILHIEADSTGAMVYWCTGAGIPGPLSVVALKKALDALKKKLQGAKRIIEQAAAKVASAVAAFGRALPAILRVLFIILLALLVLACLVIAVLCALGIPVTLGGSSICSAAAIGVAVGAAAAILLIVGVPASGLDGATANLVRASNPASAQGEPESGADYERDADNPTVPITTASAAAAAAAYDPQADFLAALGPVTNMIDSPVESAKTIANNLQSLPADTGSRLAGAAGSLDTAGDNPTASFIRSVISSSGMDQPGALAAVSSDDMSQALAQLDSSPSGGSAASAQGEVVDGAPAAAPVETTV